MLKPRAVWFGEKADELYTRLAAETGVLPQYYLTRLVVHEAKTLASALPSGEMESRLKLIREVEDEYVEILRNPPAVDYTGWRYVSKPKSIYGRVWAAHKRLEQRGKTPEEIHDYCIKRYGMDYNIIKKGTKK